MARRGRIRDLPPSGLREAPATAGAVDESPPRQIHRRVASASGSRAGAPRPGKRQSQHLWQLPARTGCHVSGIWENAGWRRGGGQVKNLKMCRLRTGRKVSPPIPSYRRQLTTCIDNHELCTLEAKTTEPATRLMPAPAGSSKRMGTFPGETGTSPRVVHVETSLHRY